MPVTDASRDVVVVGGGPVGLAAALAARRHGLATTVLEKRSGEVLDKACGEGLLPAGRAALARLGVAPDGGAAFAGIRYTDAAHTLRGDFPDGLAGLGLRRTALSAALREAAAASGVDLRSGVAVVAVEPEDAARGGAVTLASGEILRARFVVGADGLHSTVRRCARLAPENARAPRAGDRFGVTRHFTGAAPRDEVEVVFGDGAEAYLTPLGEDALGVAILWSGGAVRGGFDALVAARFDEPFRKRLAALRVAGPDRGAGPFRQRVRRRTRGAVALVGDAGGYVDALTGEGLSLGFEQAEALGEAFARGDLGVYERAARRLAATPERLTALALGVARRPALRARYVAALARDPEMFSALLGALGARRPLPTRGLVTLGARLVVPLGRVASAGLPA